MLYPLSIHVNFHMKASMTDHTPETGRITLRPARPEDVKIAVKLVHAAGPEIYNNMLGRDESTALDILEKIFVTPEALVSFDNATIAEVDGRIMGMTILYTPRQELTQGKRFFKLVWQSLSFGRFLLALAYMLGMFYMVRKVASDSLYGGTIAVFPEARSTGVGRAMMEFTMEKVRQMGLKRFEADVEIDNENALRIYDKFGFRIVAKRKTGILKRLLGFEGFYRIHFDV